MSKLILDLKVPEQYEKQPITDIIRQITTTMNLISEGRSSAHYQAQASVPTGTSYAYQVGDVVYDSNCTVRGSVAPGVASSYVRLGWICVAPGSPGTFVEWRVLTGT